VGNIIVIHPLHFGGIQTMSLENVLNAKTSDEAEVEFKNYLEKNLGYDEAKLKEWGDRFDKGANPAAFIAEVYEKIKEERTTARFGKVLGSCILWGQKHTKTVSWGVVVFILALFFLALYNIYDIYQRRKAEKKKLKTETITVYRASQLREEHGNDVVAKAIAVLPKLTTSSTQDPAQTTDRVFEGIKTAARNAASFFVAALVYLKKEKN